MTTETPPCPESPRVIRADDPAELLAVARLSFGAVPRDCLLMVGHAGHGTRPVLTCSPVREMSEPGGREHLENHLTLMRERGCTGALALLIAGDGTEPVDAHEIDDWAGVLAPMVLDVAARMLPDPFPVHPMWVLGDGSVRQVLLVAGEGDAPGEVWVSPAEELLPFDRTRAAMEAVLEGRNLRRGRAERKALRALGAQLALHPASGEPAEAADLFARARESVSRLAAAGQAGGTGSGRFVTDCEQLCAMLSALAVDAVHWELLAVCVDRGSRRSVDREELLQELTSDPSRRPHADVCAGGDWYHSLELLRDAATGAMDGPDPASAAVARDAWRGITAVLTLLSWWNHRFAAAGDLVDDLLRRDPASTLAPLLATMIDTPIPPAWWPEE